MKKYILLAFSIFLLPSISFAQNKDIAIQQIKKQKDIADYNCKNHLPNPRAAIGFCKKRDGLQRKLDNMNKGQNYNNNQHDHSDNQQDNRHNQQINYNQHH